jgi:uncharacterized membrane protein YjjP (DUF1212 family)
MQLSPHLSPVTESLSPVPLHVLRRKGQRSTSRGTTTRARIAGDIALPQLEPMAMTALEAGRMLMEAGANGGSIERIVTAVANGLGAERVDLRIGYASLAITIRVGQCGITRMCKVGHHGVNQRLEGELWNLARGVSLGQLTPEQTRQSLARLAKETPRHRPSLVALSVGVACAAFGRLLGVDWLAIGPVLLAATAGQYLRARLLARNVNVFLCTTLVSFLSATAAGVGARWAGTETFAAAMVASILFLVPGVPVVNAQSDILQGRPTLGSARLGTVVMTLIFMAAGLWAAQNAVDLLGNL